MNEENKKVLDFAKQNLALEGCFSEKMKIHEEKYQNGEISEETLISEYEKRAAEIKKQYGGK